MPGPYQAKSTCPRITVGPICPGGAACICTNRIVTVFTVGAFPSTAVYGIIDDPGLRLITCGGTFDPAAGSYESNIVAYATLTSRHPAT